MGWRFFDETIVMVERRFAYFPRTFQWRGRRFRVTSVARCWTRSRRGWQGPGRHYFQVCCAEGAFELYQDTRTAVWRLRRAKLVRGGREAWPSVSRQSAFSWR
jgi:hypothetical protein